MAQASKSARVLVIANPISGRGRGEKTARELAAALEGAGFAVEVHLTKARGDGRKRCTRLEPDIEFVVAVGGDGTLGEVLSGLPRRDVRVGVLPMGTANVLSRDLRLPHDVPSFVEMLRAGRTQAIDTAIVNREHLSFLVCGIGFDALVVRELEKRRRGPITKVDWALAAVRALAAWRNPRLVVEVDGRTLEGEYALVLVSNIVHYGGYDVLRHDRVFDDGLFEVYTFPARSRLGLLRHAVRGMFGRFPSKVVGYTRGKHVRVRAPEPVPIQIDGDLRAETPFELVVGSEPFHLLVPWGK
jgi:YegS/Rv2252/BmrU family lipid kinase